jgi:hypothetical protein
MITVNIGGEKYAVKNLNQVKYLKLALSRNARKNGDGKNEKTDRA